MLSRLYDERVFTSSDDVVFGASSSRALLRKSHGSASSPVQHRPQRGVRGMRRDELVEEDEEESKSVDSESDDSESEPAEEEADDELDEEEEDEEEVRRTAGLKFPMQSPRHIAASKSYLHRQRRRKQALQGDEPTVSHRLTQAASVSLDNNHSQMIEVQSSQHIKAQYHDRPMELVYLPNGEIRPRDECPAGLRLPPPPATDVRRLLDVPPSPWMKARSTQVRNALGDSVASSIVHITRQEAEPRKHHSRNTESFRPSAIETQPKNQKHRFRTNAYAYTHAAKGTTDDEHPPKNTSGNGLISKPRSQYEPARKELVGLQQKDPVIASEKVKADPAESSSDEERDVMSAGKFTSDRQHRNNEIESNRYLEIQLQQEKRRVLEKMTLLLEEQGKTQALQHKVNGQEEKIAALQKELDEISHREASAVNRAEQTVKESNEKIEALSTKLQEKNDEIQRLSRQLDQATVRNQSRQSEPNQPKDDEKMTRLKQREASLAKQLEDLMNRVTDFHAHVERWKTNSREAINTCANASDVSDLMDRLWKDFPPFLGGKSQSQSRCSSDEESSTIAFLTKKLRQKEDELRVTHVKYVELKELCARQCIREADLQNFINEHRLRGNLIIRKNTQSEHGLGTSSQDNDLTTENTNGVANGVRRRGRGDFALRPINSFDDDDSEGEEIVLRRPQVFIDVKRSSHSQQPETPVEHVRLEPSPASSQRHQNQRQGATTKYVQSGTIRQNKTAVNTSRSATVASAARTLGTTRLSQAPTVGRTPQAQKKSTTPAQSRATATSRIVQSRARTTAIAKRTPLSSRPWV